ncbi:MAG: sigma-70 family RNA polymerase sigma factor [Candidatus Omnitrophica bacterium]|nr:sigma-70 family RNA polymerase sigma factor [Candidatus Omnitrophota bacterium]
MRKDEEIMMEYRAGSVDALEEIFQRYKKPILNYAFKLLSSFADAEDVVGEVFYILTSRKNSYEPVAKFSTWIYTIAHNVSIDRIRRRRKILFFWQKKDKDGSSYEELDIPDTRFMPDSDAEDSDIAGYVKKAIDKLPFQLKEAIVLRQYHNLSYEEISAVLNCSLSKVKILIFRAKEVLRKELLPYMEEIR